MAGKTIYKLTVELGESVSQVFNADLDGAPLEPPTITSEGWHETKVFKNYSTFTEFQTCCQDHGVSVELLSITSEPSTSDGSLPHGLTERQYEALTLALSRGYYERPRQTTTEELSEALGISQPSMSNLLSRGERQLLSSTLGSQDHLKAISG